MRTKPQRGHSPDEHKPDAKTAAKATASHRGPPVWRQDDGAPVSCLEKIKVLNENYAELQQIAQDALEDALLIGCSESQVRSVLHQMIDALTNPYTAVAVEEQNPKKD